MAIEPKTKADQEKLGTAIQRLAEEDPTFRVQQRRGDRSDGHLRHGRAAPGHPGRPDAARVQRRGQHRQAAGGVPRDHPRHGGEGRATSTRSRPVAPASTPRSSSSVEPLPLDDGRPDLRVRQRGHRWPHPAGVHPVGGRRRAGRHAVRRPGRLPAGRRQADAARRRSTTRSTRPKWRSRSPARW